MAKRFEKFLPYLKKVFLHHDFGCSFNWTWRLFINCHKKYFFYFYTIFVRLLNILSRVGNCYSRNLTLLTFPIYLSYPTYLTYLPYLPYLPSLPSRFLQNTRLSIWLEETEEERRRSRLVQSGKRKLWEIKKGRRLKHSRTGRKGGGGGGKKK